MRIISGKNRGKKIIIPKNLPVRPTTDQSKESIFNIINNSYYFEDLKVLDLFSGSGNISYEFASRGVKKIRCVDQNSNCVRFINKTSKELNFNLKVTKCNAVKYLLSCLEQFDIIFF
ncbi:RsmD family RNA methyltransferase, partial [Flavobacteriaceae bacterium]|nr:RsmD family RNA methyltransferase [Flavobacteriaceae bacterium]